MSQEQDDKKIYTINDIAKELGVNKATVSKAISGKGNLSAETRARILDFIEKHNYRPNAVAQSLARNKTYNLALMMPDYAGVLDAAFFRDCLRGICRVAANQGYDVLMIMGGDRSVEQLERLIGNRKIDGVIAMRSLTNSPAVEFLKKEQISFVVIGPNSDPDVLSVDNDNENACRDLTTLLIARGNRHMAVLGGSECNCVTHSRLRGFWDACDKGGLKREEQMVFLDIYMENRLQEAMDIIVSKKADCIVCMDDYICNMALTHLRSYRIRIPDDVKVASFYDNILLENNIPSITSIRFDAAELGRIACRELINKLEGNPTGNFVLPGYQMYLRDSTK